MHSCRILRMLLAVSPSVFSAQILATPERIQEFFGTNAVRLSWVAQRQLHTLDFAEASPAIQGQSGTTGALVPMISPDGQWIVYGTGPLADLTNNLNIPSSAWVLPFAGGTPTLVQADSAHEPRFRVGVSHLEVVYSTVGKWGAWDGIGEVRGRRITINGQDAPQLGEESLIHAGGSYYGGVNASYIATGANNGVMRPLEGAQPLDTLIQYALRAAASPDYTNFSPRQVCNASIYPGAAHPNRMMALDFGSGGRVNDSINEGRPWGLHDLILVAGYGEGIVRTYMRPEPSSIPAFVLDDSYNGVHWDDPEWSNHPYFAVANLQVERAYSIDGDWEIEDMHEIIVAIDLRTEAVLPLLATDSVGFGVTEDLVWPTLWVDPAASGVAQESSGWMTTALANPVSRGVLAGISLKREDNSLFFSRPVEEIHILRMDGSVLESAKFAPGRLQWTWTQLPHHGIVVFREVRGSWSALRLPSEAL